VTAVCLSRCSALCRVLVHITLQMKGTRFTSILHSLPSIFYLACAPSPSPPLDRCDCAGDSVGSVTSTGFAALRPPTRFDESTRGPGDGRATTGIVNLSTAEQTTSACSIHGRDTTQLDDDTADGGDVRTLVQRAMHRRATKL
jgi:hypothetical protein